MDLICTKKPDPDQRRDMEQLVDACKEAEPLALSAPLEDDLGYDIFLLYDRERLCAMAFLFFSSDTACECCAFVHPEHRRKGYFSRLLDPVLELVDTREKTLGQSVDFCFLADEQTPSAMKTLKAMGAEYWYSEYRMIRPLTERDQNPLSCPLTVRMEEEHLYTALLGDRIAGTCAVLPDGPGVYLYAFQIREDLRGQGYGKQFLAAMLSVLSRTSTQVTLQVSGQNYIARNLYKKAGFQTAESLAYYIY